MQPHILREWIKRDDFTKGIKVDDESLKCLAHNLNQFDVEINSAIRFFVLGVACGIQSHAREVNQNSN